MATNYSGFSMAQQPTPQLYPTMVNVPSFFPQPIGNVYNLQTASEIGNIPAGNGLSVGLCLPEGVMCIKSLQNGAPVLVEYRLSTSIEGREAPKNEDKNEFQKINKTFERYDEKFSRIEGQLKSLKTKLGGEPDWQV